MTQNLVGSADVDGMGAQPRDRVRTSNVPMSETELQSNVVDLAALLGWDLVYHPYDSRRSNPGYPDLTLCRPPRVLWAELKTRTGRFEPEQPLWLDGLLACRAEVFVWRPQHWLSGVVEEVLQSVTPIDPRRSDWLRLGGWDPSLAIGKTKRPRGTGRRSMKRGPVR